MCSSDLGFDLLGAFKSAQCFIVGHDYTWKESRWYDKLNIKIDKYKCERCGRNSYMKVYGDGHEEEISEAEFNTRWS